MDSSSGKQRDQPYIVPIVKGLVQTSPLSVDKCDHLELRGDLQGVNEGPGSDALLNLHFLLLHESTYQADGMHGDLHGTILILHGITVSTMEALLLPRALSIVEAVPDTHVRETFRTR